MLLGGSRQANVVEDFFANRAGFHRQLLKESSGHDLRGKKDRGMKKSGKWADRLFFRVLARITPPSQVMKKAVQDAGIVVMAFYFEACDVFEVPNAAS